jgi:hypothetical protein
MIELQRLRDCNRLKHLACGALSCAVVALAFSAPAIAWDTAQMSKLERFEQQALGQNNYDMALDARLSQVETKLFGSAGSGSIKHRLRAVERKLCPSAVSDEDEPAVKSTQPASSSAAAETNPKAERSKSHSKEPHNKAQANSSSEAGNESNSAASKPSVKPGGMSIDSSQPMNKPMFDPPQSST